MSILISLYIWSFLVITLLPLFIVYSVVWTLDDSIRHIKPHLQE